MLHKVMTGLVVVSALCAEAYAQTSTTNNAKTTTQKKSTTQSKTAAQKQAEVKKKAEAEAKAKAEAEAKAKAEAEANMTFGQKVFNHIKKRASLTYYGEFAVFRDENNNLDSLSWMHLPTVAYRPIDNWRIQASAEFKYHDSGNYGTYINRHYRSLYSITRENILTEAEDGLKLDLGIARRQFDQKAATSSYGNWRLTANLRKTINPKMSTSLYALYMLNDVNDRGRNSLNSWKHSIDLIPSFSWQITDKLSYFWNNDIVLYTARKTGQGDDWYISHEMNLAYLSYQFTDLYSAYFQFKYIHYRTAGQNGGSIFSDEKGHQVDQFDYYIGQTFQITPKVSFTTEIGSTIFKSRDGKDFFANDIKYPGVYFFISASL